ncbi:hypothetical protein CMO92_03655 [Candidatus Woesearchaeota archaeon]|nr:hypothetical protein [Candidatus Woesearchaeota archaeon]|tara:strand:+ start:1272 stop:2321 length:1050 start_codon:yes stop_codon:yes gene_type:complete
MVWFKVFGWQENPLDVRPNSELIGLEGQEEQLRNHIDKGEVCFLNGLTGSGKSSLLKRMQEEMTGHKFIYLDAQDLPPGFNLEEELKKKRSFFDMITFKKFPSKEPVLIIDEFQDTDPDLILEARGKWESSYDRKIKSIIVAQISRSLKNVTASFKERLGNRVIQTRTLDDEEMKEILRIRLNARGKNIYNKLHSETLNLLVACADGNPRRLLEYTDYIFDFHHRKFGKNNPLITNRTYMVSYWGAKEILGLYSVNVSQYKYLESEKKKRNYKSFERKFKKNERELLLYLLPKPLSYKALAAKCKMTEHQVRAFVTSLRKKGAIVDAGTKNRKKILAVSNHVKRLTVKV